jgi:hypothetical protein
MSKLRWEAKAAKRVLAEAGLREALGQIGKAYETGGPQTAGPGSRYVRALYLIRHVEALLRQSEGA